MQPSENRFDTAYHQLYAGEPEHLYVPRFFLLDR